MATSPKPGVGRGAQGTEGILPRGRKYHRNWTHTEAQTTEMYHPNQQREKPGCPLPVSSQFASNASHWENLFRSQLAQKPGKADVKGWAWSSSESKWANDPHNRQKLTEYSHAPQNHISANDRLHIWWWSQRITIELKNSYHLGGS